MVYANIQLSNPLRPDLAPREMEASVDSGAINLCIPEALRYELGLEVRDGVMVEMADGSLVDVDVVSPVDIRFKNRFTTTTAMIIGEEVLLGAIAMQGMDVLIDPRAEQLILPPGRQDFALAKVK